MPKSGKRSNLSPSDERKLPRMSRNRPGVTSRTGNSVYLAVVLVDGIMILHLKSAARRFRLGHSWCSYRTVIPNKGYRITLSFWKQTLQTTLVRYPELFQKLARKSIRPRFNVLWNF